MHTDTDSGIQTRNSVKIVLINENNEILLMRTDDPSIRSSDGTYRGCFWQLVGGSMEPGEGIYDTARRELFEETSLEDVDFGDVIWQCTFDLKMKGALTRIFQRFILARAKTADISLAHLTDEEKSTVQRLQWFSLDDIANCKDIIYPIGLAQYLKPILDGDIPTTPVELPP